MDRISCQHQRHLSCLVSICYGTTRNCLSFLCSTFNYALSVIFVFIFITDSQASELAFSRNARTFETQYSTLVIKSLGFACLSLDHVPDGLLCNPAFVSKGKKNNLRAQGLLSNGYSNLSKTRRILSDSSNQTLITDLFSEDKVLQTEAQIQLNFISSFINASYSPFVFKYFSVARNVANPDMELFAVDQQELVLQFGYSFENFGIGIELKKQDWKFIRQRFKLLSLLSSQGLDALKPRNQTTYFADPGAYLQLPIAWKPTLSAKIVNVGTTSQAYDEFKHPSEAQFGLGISPDMPIGKLNLMIDYKRLNYEEETLQDKLHYGMLYEFGVMNLGVGIDENGFSTGIYYEIEKVNAGVLYSTTKVPWKEADYYAQTVYLQLGWQM
jgi:hypothetical protein